MGGLSAESVGVTRTHVRLAVQAVGGLVLIVYGVARVIGTITWELPAAAYLVAGVALLVSGAWLARQ